MIPKLKAQELIEKFNKITDKGGAVMCALIAVDEILNHEKERHSVLDGATEYWQEVRTEIEASR